MRMHGIYEDVRYALRQIAGNRMLSLAVFLSLALGVGVSASMFGVVDSFLLRPLPAPQTNNIVRITSVTKSSAVGHFSYPDFDDLRKRATVFETLTTARDEGAAIDTHKGAQPRLTFELIVSGDFFRMLRLQPVMGRAFRPDEDETPDRDAVAIISYAMWQRDFGGSPDVIGKTLQVNTKEFTIIGVVPQTFTGVNPMLHSEFYVPRMMENVLSDPGTHPLANRGLRSVEVYGRLKPGVSIQQAREEVARIAAQLEKENPASNRGQSMSVYTQVGFRIAEDPSDLTTAMLFVFVGMLVLGIACVNVGNLLLSTAPARTRETAVRLAMGATRARLMRQFIVESCVLSAVATAAGLGIAALVARFVRSIEIGSGLVPVTFDVRVDARVALFAFAVGVGSGSLSGLIPALRCLRGDLNQLMRSADPRVARSKRSFRRVLVAAQVTLATVVLVVSGLALQSLSLLKKADPGFRVDNVLTMSFSPTMVRGFSVAESHHFYEQLLERVGKVPGAQAVGLGHHVPLGILSRAVDVTIGGYAMPEGQHSISISSGIVSEGYFGTLGIAILRGRAFNLHDTDDAPKVAIVNQAMAEKYWPGGDPLGRRIEIHGPKAASVEVVGIARTTKYRTFQERSLPFMYVPLRQTDETFMYLFVATKDDPASYIPAVRNAVREVDQTQPIYDMHTMTDSVRRQALWGEKLAAQIASGAGIAALLLGVLGLYGMLAYSVSQRTREIGIRMAVGATSGRVSSMIVLQGLKLSIGGIVVGVILAEALASAIPDMFIPADPDDPMVYAMVVAVLLAVTLLSSYLPARRAAGIDPNECLRCE